LTYSQNKSRMLSAFQEAILKRRGPDDFDFKSDFLTKKLTE
jgi:hypothetical protein